MQHRTTAANVRLLSISGWSSILFRVHPQLHTHSVEDGVSEWTVEGAETERRGHNRQFKRDAVMHH